MLFNSRSKGAVFFHSLNSQNLVIKCLPPFKPSLRFSKELIPAYVD